MGRSRGVIRVGLNEIDEQLMHPSTSRGEHGSGGHSERQSRLDQSDGPLRRLRALRPAIEDQEAGEVIAKLFG